MMYKSALLSHWTFRQKRYYKFAEEIYIRGRLLNKWNCCSWYSWYDTCYNVYVPIEVHHTGQLIILPYVFDPKKELFNASTCTYWGNVIFETVANMLNNLWELQEISCYMPNKLILNDIMLLKIGFYYSWYHYDELYSKILMYLRHQYSVSFISRQFINIYMYMVWITYIYYSSILFLI